MANKNKKINTEKCSRNTVLFRVFIFILIIMVCLLSKTTVKEYNVDSKLKLAGLANYPYESIKVRFNNSNNTLKSRTVKGALDEILSSIGSDCYVGYTKGNATEALYTCTKNSSDSNSTKDLEASEVAYNNSTSGLSATTVQAAIQELAAKFSYCKENHTKENVTSTSYDCRANILESTLSLTNGSVSLTYGTNGENTYTYNGDGTVSCSSSNTNYVTCSVNTSTKKISLTPKAKTSSSVTITISAPATSYYTAPTPVTFTVDVAAKSITASVSSCNNKTYDRKDSAECTISLSGVISGDSTTPNASCKFNNMNVGTGKTVTCTSFTTGNNNYTVSTTSATSSANITAKSITASISSCNNKTWNGNDTANCSISLSGVISGDSSTGGASCKFADSNAGTNKTVTCTTFTSSNTNYTVSTTSKTSTANITKADSSITCKSSQGYTGSAITAYSASSGCASYTNGSPTSIGSYTVTCNGDDNHNDSTCSFSITAANSIAAAYIKQLGSSKGIRNVADAYRFSGASVNNYVKYNGVNWRIIGAYGNYLKITRAANVGSRGFDSSSTNLLYWEGSTLATYLNGDYYTNMGTAAKNMIETGRTWYIGYCVYGDTASEAYTNAKAKSWSITAADKKIGLVALYEYLYSAESSCDSKGGNTFGSSGCASKTWMKPSSNYTMTSGYVWTINTHTNNKKGQAVAITYGGVVSGQSKSSSYHVWPTVYLKSTVRICSGSGTSGTPWVLATSC